MNPISSKIASFLSRHIFTSLHALITGLPLGEHQVQVPKPARKRILGSCDQTATVVAGWEGNIETCDEHADYDAEFHQRELFADTAESSLREGKLVGGMNKMGGGVLKSKDGGRPGRVWRMENGDLQYEHEEEMMD